MIGCPEGKHLHAHTTPKSIETAIASVLNMILFVSEIEINTLQVFVSDFSLHTDLVLLGSYIVRESEISWYA